MLISSVSFDLQIMKSERYRWIGFVLASVVVLFEEAFVYVASGGGDFKGGFLERAYVDGGASACGVEDVDSGVGAAEVGDAEDAFPFGDGEAKAERAGVVRARHILARGSLGPSTGIMPIANNYVGAVVARARVIGICEEGKNSGADGG